MNEVAAHRRLLQTQARALIVAIAVTVDCGGTVTPQSDSSDADVEPSGSDAGDSAVTTGSDDGANADVADGGPAPLDASPSEASEDEEGGGDAGCSVPCSGTCLDGRCLEVLASTGPNGCSSAAYDLALDDNDIYWVGLAADRLSSDAMKAPVGGGPCVTLATGLATPPSDALGIAVDSTTAYITADTAVLAVPLDGGMPATLASLQGGARNVAAVPLPFTPGSHATNVYWTVDGLGVWMVPVTGGTPVEVSPQPGALPMGLALDSLDVYWTAGGSPSGYVWQASLDGGTVTRLTANAGNPLGIATDGKNVYWVDSANGTVNSIPVGGGVITMIATGQSQPSAVALDDAYVYWTNGGSVAKAPLVGSADAGSPITLTTAAGGGRIAVDATSVYFISGSSSVTPNGGIVKITPK